MSDATLREILKEEYAADLPISGGLGDSMKGAIRVEKECTDRAELERQIIDYCAQLLGYEWKMLETRPAKRLGRVYDKVAIERKDDPDNYYTYYFDVTDCVST